MRASHTYTCISNYFYYYIKYFVTFLVNQRKNAIHYNEATARKMYFCILPVFQWNIFLLLKIQTFRKSINQGCLQLIKFWFRNKGRLQYYPNIYLFAYLFLLEKPVCFIFRVKSFSKDKKRNLKTFWRNWRIVIWRIQFLL